ncbi:MAG: hypothetical protein RLZZ117_145 [Cyanobacteriota bacterium]
MRQPLLAPTINLLLARRQGRANGHAVLVGCGPHGAAGDITRAESLVICGMGERCGIVERCGMFLEGRKDSDLAEPIDLKCADEHPCALEFRGTAVAQIHKPTQAADPLLREGLKVDHMWSYIKVGDD